MQDQNRYFGQPTALRKAVKHFHYIYGGKLVQLISALPSRMYQRRLLTADLKEWQHQRDVTEFCIG